MIAAIIEKVLSDLLIFKLFYKL